MEKRPEGQLRNLNFDLSKHVETQMNDLSARSCKQLTVELEDHNLKTLSGEKCSSETTSQDGHCHGYAPFPFSA